MKFSTYIHGPASPNHKPAWYSFYSRVMLESNACSVLSNIELTQMAIQDRIVELVYLGSTDNREFLDIVNALSHLQILLRIWHEEDRVLLWQQ
jgi:hypothetical protein